MMCAICGTWQHARCYGYRKKFTATMPPEHVCYSCLLLPLEPGLLDNMASLIAMRNAMHYLILYPLQGDEDFRKLAKMLRECFIDRAEARTDSVGYPGKLGTLYDSSLMDDLEVRGYVHRDGERLLSGQPNQSQADEIMAAVLHPLTGIYHHVIRFHSC